MASSQNWTDTMEELRDELMQRTWFGFDLDDTLHEFRKASSTASSKVLEHVKDRYNIPMRQLNTAYLKILHSSTASAFTDGKTSDDYRKSRFRGVLNDLSLDYDDAFLTLLAKIYKHALEDDLQLKYGTIDLLMYLRAIGKKIAIITEGPQDAQEWTLEKLGLDKHIDFLATSNYFRASKVQGLLGCVLNHLHIEAEDMVYIGDSKDRDMSPAMAQGIFCIHYAEGEIFSLDSRPVTINTLMELKYILMSVGPRLGSSEAGVDCQSSE